MTTTAAPTMPADGAKPTFGEAFRIWFKIGCLSFGGPAGQIATMHRILVDEKKWIDEPRYLHALNYCMLLPGPEAQQLATYVGWLLHGIRGGLVAGLLFVLPGALVMLGLSFIYVLARGLPVVDGALFGIKAAVLVVVVEAIVRNRQACVEVVAADRDRGLGVRRHLPARTAVPADRDRGRPGRLLGRPHDARAARHQAARGRPAAEASRPLARGRHRRGGLVRGLVGAGRARRARPRPAARACVTRCVLLQARGGELRRRLCADGLYGAGGGGRAGLAEAARDGRRARPRRDHTGAAHPGDTVRRVPGGLP